VAKAAREEVWLETSSEAGRARLTGTPYVAFLFALALALFGAIVMSVGIGEVPIPASHSAQVVGHHLLPGLVGPIADDIQDQIIWEFRLPRELLAALVGGGLAVVGTVLQALVRNPLADPYLLGVSAGASLGAVAVVVLASGVVGEPPVSFGAFAGAIAATALVYAIAQRRGRIAPARLVLAGVAVAYLFDAAFSYLILRQPRYSNAHDILFWLLGSFAAAKWSTLALPAAVLLVCCALLLLQARPLNALLAGEETAASLGVNVARFRLLMVALTALLTGVMVAIAGAVGFIGLVVPHVVRLVVGTDHRRVLPAAMLTGALFAVLADLTARKLSPGQELPLSVVTAVVGVPVFLILMRRQTGGEYGARTAPRRRNAGVRQREAGA
jgi:iron complex transport system permease protein